MPEDWTSQMGNEGRMKAYALDCDADGRVSGVQNNRDWGKGNIIPATTTIEWGRGIRLNGSLQMALVKGI